MALQRFDQRYTGEKLRDIGIHFGIDASGVSQACRRVAQKIEIDEKLKRKINKIEKKINLSRMKIYPACRRCRRAVPRRFGKSYWGEIFIQLALLAQLNRAPSGVQPG